MIDSIRHFLAVLLLVFITPAIFSWFLIHPFIRLWRRVGPGLTYTVVILFANLSALLLYLLRHRLVGGDRGFSLPLGVFGLACLILSGVMRQSLRRQLSSRTLLGLPEVAPDRMPQPLLTSGIYSRIRHPRYVQFLLGVLGYCCIVNYRSIYLLWLIWLPGIHLIVLLEERELRERFGREYEEYARRVPRFLPRFSSRG
jgi:protein-S-isoprenylcysteine O-methyltransferase Ste14